MTLLNWHFKQEAYVDWSVFWSAFGGIAQAAAAVATFLAVGVALWLGIREGKRSLRARYDEARPILIVTSDPQAIKTQQGNDPLLDWNNQHQVVKVQNVGKGIALNVRSVIYGPESVIIKSYSQQPVSDTSARDTHWYYWKSDVVRVNEEKELDHHLGASTFEPGNKHIQQYSFNAPAQPFWNPQQQEPTCLCRLSLTYHDIFHRKHASIFDLVLQSGWQVIDTLEAIPQDLHDLETS